jgi:hypothetical protein
VRIRLRFFIANLRQISTLLFRQQPADAEAQKYVSESPKCRKLSIVDVRWLVFFEPVDKKPAIIEIGCDHDSRAPALASSRCGNPLLEHMPTQIRVNQTGGHLCDRIAQVSVSKRRFAQPAVKRLRLEDPTPGTHYIT